jgi:hypothetical protein
MINDTPYSILTHSNPWLINTNEKDAIIGPEGVGLTASYIWEKKGKEREDLVNWVFTYYRKNGFPYSGLLDSDLLKKFKALKKKDQDDVIDKNGHIKNTSSLCNNVYKHFAWEKYYSSKGGEKTKSVVEVFNNDELLLNVIKNRMGYCLTKEDGEERPYIFTITDRMVLQGIRSTGYGYNVSLFKPVIAKYLYKHYAISSVLDFASGWGARALSAMSLDLEYYGIDPLTHLEVNNMIKFFGGNGIVIDGCSEDKEAYKDIPMVDCIMSCSPYFDLEIYSEDKNQSVNKYSNYNDWINIYWDNTVVNCLSKLKEKGYFIVILKDKIKKYNLSEDMINICEKNNLVIEKKIYYKTLKNHLSGKKKTKKVSKNNEVVYIMKRRDL